MVGKKKEIRDAVDKIGSQAGKERGKNFQKIARDVLEKRLLPKNAIGLSDAMVEGIYSQAYRLYNAGKYNDAVQLFRLLIMLNSTEAKYTLGFAACFHMMKKHKPAIDAYTLCSVIDPTSPVPYYHAADCYIQMNDPASAVISLEMAVKRAGETPEFLPLKDRAKMMIKRLKKELKEKGMIK